MNSYQVNRAIREAIAFSAIVDIDGVMNPKTGGFHLVQDALDAGHQSIFVRVGTYPPFDIETAETTVIGESWDAHIAAPAGVSAVTISAANCKVANIQASTPAGAGQIFHGFAIAAAYVTIEDCYTAESDADGVFWYNVTGTVVRGGRFTGGDRHGIACVGTYSKISGVRCDNNGTDGIYIAGAGGDSSIVTGCVLVDNGQYGVQIAANDENCVIVGNRAGGNTTGQIADASGTSTVTGNNEN